MGMANSRRMECLKMEVVPFSKRKDQRERKLIKILTAANEYISNF